MQLSYSKGNPRVTEGLRLHVVCVCMYNGTMHKKKRKRRLFCGSRALK